MLRVAVALSIFQWGSNTSISDITPAAGWLILSCNSSALSTSASASNNATQVDVTLVCSASDVTAAGCDHLFENGAEGTLVRVPVQNGSTVQNVRPILGSFLFHKPKF